MLFLASELWPLAAATAWIALGVLIAGLAVAGRKRGGSRQGTRAPAVLHLFFERAPRSGGIGPFLGRVS